MAPWLAAGENSKGRRAQAVRRASRFRAWASVSAAAGPEVMPVNIRLSSKLRTAPLTDLVLQPPGTWANSPPRRKKADHGAPLRVGHKGQHY